MCFCVFEREVLGKFILNSLTRVTLQVAFEFIQELSGDPNPQYFLKSIVVEIGGVLQYRLEAYCSTDGRLIEYKWEVYSWVSLQSFEARKAQRYKCGHTAVQIGGILQYFLRDQ